MYNVFDKLIKDTLRSLVKNKKHLEATIMEKINGQTPKNGVVFDTTSNVQPI